jgi:ABC-type branched-subunit amino acid transport system substrate-binding protein
MACVLMAGAAATAAEPSKRYDPGASDTEIIVGNTNPYSGPASAYGMVGLAGAAYVRMINDQGGVNGRKVKFISYDDAYSPPKTVEQTRKLVESDNVLFIFSSIGTAPSLAVQKYMNTKGVPQIFVASGSSKWGDPKNFPWSIGYQVNFLTEGRVFGKFITQDYPNAKVAVLYQNDDMGKELLKGLKEALGRKENQVVAAAPYEVTDPTVDAQVLALRASGADLFVNFTSPKAAAQAIKKVSEIGWKPVQLVTKVS